MPSINALAETQIGLFKTEVIHRLGPWKGIDDVELAVLGWVDWRNHRRLHSACHDLTPTEYEQIYYRQHPAQQACPESQQPESPDTPGRLTGDERLDAVEDRIDEAKEAADRVQDKSRSTRAWACATARRTSTAPSSPRATTGTRGRTRARGATREPWARPRSGDRRARRPQPGAGSAPAARLTSARRCSRKARSAAFAVSSIARRYD